MLPVANEPAVLEDQVVYITDIGHLRFHRGILLCVWGFTQYMRAGGENCTPACKDEGCRKILFGFCSHALDRTGGFVVF